MMRKKSQSEIVGFVLIVVIVMVVGLIFLGFSIGRGQTSKQNSVEIGNFLEASMSYTTKCSINGYYSEMQDLIKACYDNKNCGDGTSSCDFAKEELKRIVTESFNIGENSPNKAYNLEAYYSVSNATIRENLFNDSVGRFENCSSRPGAESIIVDNSMSSGSISVDMEICRIS